MWLHSVKDPTSRLVRWRLKLAEYEYKVQYKAGKINLNADALSRNPIEINQQILKINQTRPNTSDNIKIVSGDLFTANEEYSLAHCVAKDFRMGAGIALEFRKRFRGVRMLKNQNKTIGEVAYLPHGKRYIFYLITKEVSYGKPTIKSIERSLFALRNLCIKLNCYKIAMPKIGCGLDKLSWPDVEEKIRIIFPEPFTILIYENKINSTSEPTSPITNSAKDDPYQVPPSENDISNANCATPMPSTAKPKHSQIEIPHRILRDRNNIRKPQWYSDPLNGNNHTQNLDDITDDDCSRQSSNQHNRSDSESCDTDKDDQPRFDSREFILSDNKDSDQDSDDDERDAGFRPNIEYSTDSNSEIIPSQDEDNPLPGPRDDFPMEPEPRQFSETRDNLALQKGNLVFFITTHGQPCDEGARNLQSAGKLPPFTDVMLGRPKIQESGKTRYVGLAIKETIHTNLDEGIFKDALQSLLEVVRELQLDTLIISETQNIDHFSWSKIKLQLQQLFYDTPCKFIVCKNLIKIPPEDERISLIREYHASPIGGHKGMIKTYRRIRQYYYWTNMKAQIEEYIRNCLECQLKKLTRVKTRQPMVLTDTPGASFDKISMDIVGPLPTSPSGNEYILTIQDQLSKYCLAIPLETTTSAKIAEALIKNVFFKFGAPKYILTDQGANLISSLMKAVAKKFRIKQCRTTAFHPQSNGSIERSHHVLVEYLKQYIKKTNNWDEWLDCAMFSYNTSVHEGTKFTPHELVFGRLARLPSEHTTIDERLDRSYEDYLKQLFTTLKNLQTEARENLIKAKERYKYYYDRKINPLHLSEGDEVFLLKEPRDGKFGDHYTGPYKVLEILNNQNVRIKVKNNNRVVHRNKLKRMMHQTYDPTRI
ncbi:uncharacterized protein LOC125501328 [Athalia rosae]|uniref:uncharacterized protein LOC125501328 n=1 Tax=Athalia rosae TaxID=37344 RepID=UPI002033C3A6|nr:uncharacterized protein LOC125501328 [Athalia rosae]